MGGVTAQRRHVCSNARDIHFEELHIWKLERPQTARPGVHNVDKDHLLEHLREFRQGNIVKKAGSEHNRLASARRQPGCVQQTGAGVFQVFAPLLPTTLVPGANLNGRL
jgi:hypothetical protein